MAIGHELCGRVKDPPLGSPFQDGEAVMVDPRIPCRDCVPCNDGIQQSCKKIGYIGGSTGGGFGERVVVNEDHLYPLGPNIPLEYAAVIEPLAVVHHAVKETGIQDWTQMIVLVLGGGPIGFALLIDLKAHGATNIIVSEPTKTRRDQLSEYASAVLNPIEENVGKKCLDMTKGKGVDVVFDCAGVPAGLDAGFEALKIQGLYLNVAVWEQPLLSKHITVKGVLIFSTEEFKEVMQWMAEGKLVGYEKMVTSWITIDDIVDKGFNELVNNKDKHIKIFVSPKEVLPVS